MEGKNEVDQFISKGIECEYFGKKRFSIKKGHLKKCLNVKGENDDRTID